jgi:hypothetical protein
MPPSKGLARINPASLYGRCSHERALETYREARFPAEALSAVRRQRGTSPLLPPISPPRPPLKRLKRHPHSPQPSALVRGATRLFISNNNPRATQKVSLLPRASLPIRIEPFPFQPPPHPVPTSAIHIDRPPTGCSRYALEKKTSLKLSRRRRRPQVPAPRQRDGLGNGVLGPPSVRALRAAAGCI